MGGRKLLRVGLRLDAEVDRTLIEHWNGKTWTTAASPCGGQLSAVSAASATSAWAVGFSGPAR